MQKHSKISFRMLLASLGKNFTSHYNRLGSDPALQIVAPAWWGHLFFVFITVYDLSQKIRVHLVDDAQAARPLLRLFVSNGFPFLSRKYVEGKSYKSIYLGLFWRRSPAGYQVAIEHELGLESAEAAPCVRVMPVFEHQRPKGEAEPALDMVLQVAKNAPPDAAMEALRPLMAKHAAKLFRSEIDRQALVLIYAKLRVNFRTVSKATRAVEFPQVMALKEMVADVLAPDFMGPHSYSRRLDLMPDAEMTDQIDLLFDFFKQNGITVFLNSGTLLGAVRENNFIAHDDDIDLAVLVPGNSFEEVGAAWTAIRSKMAEHYSLNMKRYIAALILDNGVQIDLFPCWVMNEKVSVYPYSFEKLAVSDVFPLGVVNLRGKLFPAPLDTSVVLSLNYGPNWQKPDPSWRFDWDGAAVDFKSVLPHLIWKERSE